MSNLSIYEKKWLDLVFEGRNQEYGAYQLRLQNPRTTALSLLLGILFFGAALIGTLQIMDNGVVAVTPTFDPDIIIEFTDITPPKPPTIEKEILPLVKPDEDVTKKKLLDPEIVKGDENPDDVMTNKEAIKPQPSEGDNGEGNADGASTGNGNTGNTNGNATGTDSGNDDAVISATLDKLPEFPGGIEKFLGYVGKNFRQPNFSNTNVDGSKAIKVLMSFVIEKDGSMTDIKVLRNPGYGLDKEAIRVLKSQKTKWKPGIKNGKPVRTLYTLPISIVLQ